MDKIKEIGHFPSISDGYNKASFGLKRKKGYGKRRNPLFYMVGRAGIEPAAR
jgi:hypothetical protein